MNDTDLASRIDRSFGEGPGPRPVETHLHSGRRALLRRRLAGGAGALVVLAAVSTGLVVAGGGGDRPGSAPSDQGFGPAAAPDDAAPDGPAPATPTIPAPSGDVRRADLGPGGLVAVDPDGTLVLAPGVRLLERIDDPFTSLSDDPSVAVALVRGGQERWALVSSSGYEISGPADRDYADLAAWTDDMVANVAANGGLADDSGNDGGPDVTDLQSLRLVRFGAGEALEAEPGATILDQSGEVDLGDRFAAPGDRTAVARVDHDGDVLYVLARQLDGSRPEYVVYPQTPRTGTTLATFLDFAATRYEPDESGGSEGLR